MMQSVLCNGTRIVSKFDLVYQLNYTSAYILCVVESSTFLYFYFFLAVFCSSQNHYKYDGIRGRSNG
jgi:hypothetical protein